MCEDYYTILRCYPGASYETIKRNYQELAKKFHPDKSSEDTGEDFNKIDKAWKVLRDEELRREYDAKRLQSDFSTNPMIYASLQIADLSFNNNIALYPCRCGHHFVIEDDLIWGECIFECSECTNCILVKR